MLMTPPRLPCQDRSLEVWPVDNGPDSPSEDDQSRGYRSDDLAPSVLRIGSRPDATGQHSIVKEQSRNRGSRGSVYGSSPAYPTSDTTGYLAMVGLESALTRLST